MAQQKTTTVVFAGTDTYGRPIYRPISKEQIERLNKYHQNRWACSENM